MERSILIVGDAHPRSIHFFHKIWEKVFERCVIARGGASTLPSEFTSEAAVSNADKPEPWPELYQRYNTWLDNHASEIACLVPRPFLAEAYRQEEYKKSLEESLLRWDVWAVLSAAPSNVTEVLIDALAPTGIPLLLAVDSTTLNYRLRQATSPEIDFACSRPPLLQLNADNSQQASAIYAALQGLRSHRSTGKKAWIWAPDMNDPYVEDLVEEISNRGQTPARDLSLDLIQSLDLIPPSDLRGTLAFVYVGYDAKTLDDQLAKHPEIPFLVADGVSKRDSAAWQNRNKRHTPTLFFEPTSLFEHSADDAYEACLVALNDQIFGNGAQQPKTYAQAIRNRLKKHYSFTREGANSAAGFAPRGYTGNGG